MSSKQCEFMIVTRQCPNPALEGFDLCIVHLGSDGLEHWLAVAKTTAAVAAKAASYAKLAIAIWKHIPPLLRADQKEDRAVEYARIIERLDRVAAMTIDDSTNRQVLQMKHELETLVMDFDSLLKSATATAEDNAAVGADS